LNSVPQARTRDAAAVRAKNNGTPLPLEAADFLD
jgi:hypothetical protein